MAFSGSIASARAAGRRGGRAFAVLLWAVLAAAVPAQGFAEPLPQPSGEVLLSVAGAIETTNAEGEARFDRAMLEALGMERLETSNPFEPGVHVFEGPRLSAVLDRVGARGSTVTAKALDGYEIDIPFSDAADYGVLLAMRWNGETMTVRRKGPIWIVYPVDQNPELNIESFSSRSIWQLSRLTVR
jgi:hypothetical protein